MEIITNACLVCTLVYQWIHNPQIQSNSCKLEKGRVNLIINGPNGLSCYQSLTQPLPDLLKQIFHYIDPCATHLLAHVILIIYSTSTCLMCGPSVHKAASATLEKAVIQNFFFFIYMHCINYLKMFIYMYACMWNVVMCMLSKINYKKENIQLMLSFGLKTNTIQRFHQQGMFLFFFSIMTRYMLLYIISLSRDST